MPTFDGCSLRSPHTDQLDHELARFQCIKRVLHGQEVNVYEGPQLPGEHDDTVIALALANWGRAAGAGAHDPTAGDFSGWADGLEDQLGIRPASGAPSSGGDDLGDWSPNASAGDFGGW